MLYHVTAASSLPSILEDGIKPAIGPRSALGGETMEFVYAFASIDAVEDALTGWLGDELAEEDEIVILCLNLDAEPRTGQFEVTLDCTVSPERIVKVLGEDLEEVDLGSYAPAARRSV